MEIHSLRILEAKNQKSRCHRGHAFLGGLWGRNYSSEVSVPVLSRVWLFVTPRDCSPPGSAVHGIFQTRMPDRLPLATPGDLPNPGIKPSSLASPALAGWFFTSAHLDVAGSSGVPQAVGTSRQCLPPAFHEGFSVCLFPSYRDNVYLGLGLTLHLIVTWLPLWWPCLQIR